MDYKTPFPGTRESRIKSFLKQYVGSTNEQIKEIYFSRYGSTEDNQRLFSNTKVREKKRNGVYCIPFVLVPIYISDKELRRLGLSSRNDPRINWIQSVDIPHAEFKRYKKARAIYERNHGNNVQSKLEL